MVLACWQSKKRCWIVSLRSQKQHFLLPDQFLLAKLSLVKITPCWRYQRKKFINKGCFLIHQVLVHRPYCKIVMSMQVPGKNVPPIGKLVSRYFSYKVIPGSHFIFNQSSFKRDIQWRSIHNTCHCNMRIIDYII